MTATLRRDKSKVGRCPECLHEFHTRDKRQVYCSRNCSSRARERRGRDRSNDRKRVAVTAEYLQVQAIGHPLVGKNGVIRIHRKVLFEKVGPGDQACHWCGVPLAWFPKPGVERLLTDHVDGDKWNNDPDNLVPTCNRCNVTRMTTGPDFLNKCVAGHPRTPENTYNPPNVFNPQCRTCRRDTQRARRAKKRAALAAGGAT